jgi:hypothetical protein
MKKTARSEHSPIAQKFAHSGHPGPQLNDILLVTSYFRIPYFVLQHVGTYKFADRFGEPLWLSGKVVKMRK